MSGLPDVYGYLDYRAYLRDYYAAKKAKGRGFSFRSFSRRAKVASPNYLKLVMEGDRNLTPEMAERFAVACGLEGEHRDFFSALVAFTQARTPGQRSEAYEKMLTFRRYRSARKLELLQLVYASTWYLPAIRELAARRDFRDDPEWVARMLVPSIATAEARSGLDTLMQLGLLTRDGEGRLRQSDPIVTTGPEAASVHATNYHRTMIARASAAIDTIPAPQRDVSALVLCLSPSGLGIVKERIQKFRRELLELSSAEPDPRQVVQINFQLFPLSRAEEET